MSTEIIKDYYKSQDIYNDGDVETQLLNHYINNSDINKYQDDLFFFTTDIRKNILNWYPFKKSGTLLEIGAGTGIITEMLCEKCKKVTAIEGSLRRCQIIKERLKEKNNLKIIAGNFNDIKLREKFDYIVLIGVFEYSKMFGSGFDPFGTFLKNMKKCLKPNGKILMAIENRYGLKYWAGNKEDHLGKKYSGLYGYKDSKIQTFGLNELTEIIKNNGFEKYKLYFPMPDYKLPSVIYTEDRLPMKIELKGMPLYNYSEEEYNFDPRLIFDGLLDNKMFAFFANSFLIEFGSDKCTLSNISYAKTQPERNKQYQVLTTISNNNIIKKTPIYKEAENHLETFRSTHKKIKALGIKTCEITKKGKKYYIENIKGEILSEYIQDLINNGKFVEAEKEVDNYVNFLKSISDKVELTNPFSQNLVSLYNNGKVTEILKIGLLDLHMSNIIREFENSFVIIDQEWYTAKQVPTEYIINISISLLFQAINSSNNFNETYFLNKYGISNQKKIIFQESARDWFDYNKNYRNIELANFLKQHQKISLIDTKYLNLINEKNRIQNLSSSKDTVLIYLKKHLRYQQLNLEILTNELKEKSNEIRSTNHKIENLLNSIEQQLAPRGSRRRQFIKYIYNFVKNFLSSIRRMILWMSKNFYTLYPIEKHKLYLRNKASSSKILARILGIPHEDASAIIINGTIRKTVQPLTYLNKTIAVHLHLYYSDLLDEFYNYLSNIPYKFDLYISVSEDTNINIIRRKFKKLPHVNKIVIKISKNKGRDYGPMFVLFGNKLKRYDYLLHIHSKKSLRSGREDSDWRHYLLDAIIGSKSRVMQCFSLMENENISQVYADTYEGVPLWAHTWLDSISIARKIYSPIGIEIIDEYLDFSAGSMFWTKTIAIKELFDLNLKWEDFEEETGQRDGTLAYVLERSLSLFAKRNNLRFAVYNANQNAFIVNTTSKNVEKYCENTKQSTLEKLSKFDIISFDIFDTLTTRSLFRPDDIFKLIQKNLENNKKYPQIKEYIEIRKKAEETVRKNKNYKGDCTIDEIYSEFSKITKLNKKETNKIKNLEIETEIKLSYPRKDMLEIYNSLLKMNKKIVLLSDMYLTRKEIAKILNKCGYYDYYDLLISSEVGLRKDNGTMYEYLYKKYGENSLIHVGDNESSDIHRLENMGKPNLYVAQGKKLFELSNYNLKFNHTLNLDDSLLFGTIINKSLFNSPFSLHDQDKNSIVNDLYKYGFSILGPIFLYFFIWLINQIKKDETLLFVAREGYYLQRLFEIFRERLNIPKLNNLEHYYFLTSRRSITVANIKNISDVKDIMSRNYDNGSLRELFYYRLGFDLNIENDMVVNLPNDFSTVMNIVEHNWEEISLNSARERENYLYYINSLIYNYQNKNLSVVDLGYSGTSQYELSKLLNKKIGGYYFCVNNEKKPLARGCKMKSCFNNSLDDNDLESNTIYRYRMLLEAFLTAPTGQFTKFSTDSGILEPQFLENSLNREDEIKKLETIYSGISDLINEIIDILGNDILNMNITKDYVMRNFENFFLEKDKLNEEFKKVVNVEDNYCGNQIINLLDLWKYQKKL